MQYSYRKSRLDRAGMDRAVQIDRRGRRINAEYLPEQVAVDRYNVFLANRML